MTISAVATVAQSREIPHQPVGKIDGGNTYTNSALGVRVALPGKWHIMVPTKYAQYASDPELSKPNPECRGPLCKPAIEEALETESTPVQSLFLTGYKLESEYLNRQRYPLKKFAEAMMQGSLAGTDWVPVGSMSEVQLAGRQAYRLLVNDPSKPRKKGFGFVFEANGYICLLIGADVTPSQDLLPAVEGRIQFESSKP